MITVEEKNYLRELAKQVKEITDHDCWAEKSRLWTKLNRLEAERPMILCAITDECWPDLIKPEELKIQDPFFRKYEYDFLKTLWRWKHVKDDYVFTNKVYVPVDYEWTDWYEGRERPFAAQEAYQSDGKTAECFHPCIIEFDDLKKMTKPELKNLNWKTTQDKADALSGIFGDLLDVTIGTPYFGSIDGRAKGWGLSMIDILAELRGLQQMYMDFVMEPEFVHDCMEFLTQGLENYIDTMEKEHLLFLNNNSYWESTNTPLGANGLAITDELPGDDFDPKNVTCKNLWGFLQAQELSGVSGEMQDEFVFTYQKRLAKKFPIISYGCCEKYDYKYDELLNAFPNLREVSVCHEANLDIAAQKLQNNYVASWKPHCTIAYKDEATIEAFMRKGFESMKDTQMCISLHDNLSTFGDHDIFRRWTDITMRLAEEYHK